MITENSMRAVAWYGPGDVRLERRPVPAPGPDEALVEILYNGVCSTDHSIAEGHIDAATVAKGLTAVGIDASESDFAGLLTETIEHASRLQAQQVAKAQLDEVEVPTLELPTLGDGIDLGGLYELANLLQKAGA